MLRREPQLTLPQAGEALQWAAQAAGCRTIVSSRHQTQVPVGHVVVSELFCLQESPLTVGRWQGPTCKSSEVFILPTYTWK